MQKISSILPSSPRVGGVDLKSASAVRPGTPSFGRPVGESTGIARDGWSTAEKAANIREEMDVRLRNLSEPPEIVQKMTEQFFMQKSSAAQAPDVRSTGDLVSAEIEEGTLIQPPPNQARKEFVPPGSYVNVVA